MRRAVSNLVNKRSSGMLQHSQSGARSDGFRVLIQVMDDGPGLTQGR